jgi:hypothetical protein
MAAFATSYIKTEAASVTRNADVASMTGTNFSSWYRADEGTVYAESAVIGLRPTSTGFVFSLANSAGGNYMAIRFGSAISGSDFYVESNLTPQVDTGSFAITPNVFYKQASVYKLNDFGFVQNAATPFTDTSGLLANGVNSLNIGTNTYSGTIKKIAFYPSRLSNAQLQALTTV